MTTTITAPDTTPKMRKLVADLVTERPGWSDALEETARAAVYAVLAGVDQAEPAYVPMSEGRTAIRSLLAVPRPRPTASNALQRLLKTVPIGRFALPRKADGVWDFFEVIERKNGVRHVNQLLGSPGDYSRRYLPDNYQAAAARAISGDWKAAAVAFATETRHCAKCGAPLTHERSLKANIGPTCAVSWGWEW